MIGNVIGERVGVVIEDILIGVVIGDVIGERVGVVIESCDW